MTEVLADGTSEVSHMEAMGLSTPHGPIFGSGLPLREFITVGKLLPLTVGSSLSLTFQLSAICTSSSIECFGLKGMDLGQIYNIQQSKLLK